MTLKTPPVGSMGNGDEETPKTTQQSQEELDTDAQAIKKRELDEAALYYHKYPNPGKLAIHATKPLGNQRDLALAYSPGVAAPCLAIEKDPSTSFDYTSRGNVVAVISNGTAVLGLGSIGALAAKPVMEGKAVLFKKFAGIDCVDIEVDETEPQKFCDIVAPLEPSFGGINLEDIGAPECFEIEAALRARMNIPVFHDDQHGTAIIVAAAVRNAMEVAGKELHDIKVVTSGAGAAALACLNLLVSLGVPEANIWITDIDGVVYEGRNQITRYMEPYTKDTPHRTLSDVIEGADVFLGLSAGGVLKPDMLKKMAVNPLILALANPTPEIMPDLAREARPDAMICTGRSDFPNQVNNVLCFPYIFRGALDVGARDIDESMKLAAVEAIAALAKAPPSDVAARASSGDAQTFGPTNLIPSPFDPRLILHIAPAVAEAAMRAGLADRPITDMDAYLEQLNRFVLRSGVLMKPIVASAMADRKRVIFADGEDERVLRAAQVVIAEAIADPILVGRPSVLQTRCERYGLTIRPDRDFEVVNPQDDPRYRDYVDLYLERAGRRGVSPNAARTLVRTNTTLIGALAVERGEADALLCGLDGRIFMEHVRAIEDVLGRAPAAADFSALSLLINNRGTYFFTDTYITADPSAEEIAEMTIQGAAHIRWFGIEPRVALLSASNFGSRPLMESACKMQKALDILRSREPNLQVDGEMHADAALSDLFRNTVLPTSTLKGEANFLVFPNLDAANIGLNLLKVMTDGLHVGPILLGVAKPAHVLSNSVTSRGVVNMTALAAVDAQTFQASA